MAGKIVARNTFYLWLATTLINLLLSTAPKLFEDKEREFLGNLSTELVEGLNDSALDVENFNDRYGLNIQYILYKAGIFESMFKNPIERIQFSDTLSRNGNRLISIYYSSRHEPRINNALLSSNLADDEIRSLFLENDIDDTHRYLSIFIDHERFTLQGNHGVICQLGEIFYVNISDDSNPIIEDSYHNLRLSGEGIAAYGETLSVDIENRQILNTFPNPTSDYSESVHLIASDCLEQYYRNFEPEVRSELSEHER
jgi:hypothetical protein